MKKRITTLLAGLLPSLVIMAQGLPMHVAGDMKVATDANVLSAGSIIVGAKDVNQFGILVNNGTLTAENGITLKSNDASDGMLVNYSNSINVTGNVAVVKEFTIDKWYYMSFPFDVKISDITCPNKTVLAYGSSADFHISAYDGARRSRYNTNSGNWKVLASTEVLKAGVGYRVNLLNLPLKELVFPASATSTISTENALKVDGKTQLVQFWPLSDDPKVTTESTQMGWNFIGAQNTVSYDLYAENLSSGFNGVVYFFDKSLGRFNHEDISFSPMNIPPHYSFFIQTMGNDQTFTFPREGINIQSPGPNLRSSNSQSREELRLAISGKGQFDKLGLTFSDTYTENVDLREDASKFSKEDGYLRCWNNVSGTALCVNRLPYADSRELKLGVNILESGNYTFNIENDYAGFYEEVLLLDKVLNTETDLLTGSYSFDSSPLNSEERFVLQLHKVKSTTSTPKVEKDNVSIYVKNSRVFVNNTSQDDLVEIYDITGRLVLSQISLGTEITLDLTEKGVYIVKVSGSVSKLEKILNQ